MSLQNLEYVWKFCSSSCHREVSSRLGPQPDYLFLKVDLLITRYLDIQIRRFLGIQVLSV